MLFTVNIKYNFIAIKISIILRTPIPIITYIIFHFNNTADTIKLHIVVPVFFPNSTYDIAFCFSDVLHIFKTISFIYSLKGSLTASIIQNPIVININLNNYNISADEKVFYIEGGSLNLTGTGTIYEKNPNYGAVMLVGSENSDDVNYSTINVEDEFGGFDNIRIQTDIFDDVKVLKSFIKEITGPNQLEIKNIDVDTERFLTYSYTCIEQENWSKEEDFGNIKSVYTKYAKILPNDNNILFNSDESKIMSNWNYAKMGISKAGVTLFTSSADINNYTVLPYEYENEYLYTYILSLYMKIYIKLINLELRQGINVKNARKKFIDFTKNLWIQEATIDDVGTLYYHNLRKALELDNLYLETKNKYDVLYKEMNIEKNTTANKFIIVILLISLVITTLNFMALMGLI